jgi:hypothetical protein
MKHPFTCIVAGCTESGKTSWVKIILENAKTTINGSTHLQNVLSGAVDNVFWTELLVLFLVLNFLKKYSYK